MNFGKIASNLRKLREGAKMSTQELSDRSGVSVGHINGIEQNEANPSIDTLKLLAAVLGVDFSAIISKDDPMGSATPYGERSDDRDKPSKDRDEEPWTTNPNAKNEDPIDWKVRMENELGRD